MVDQPKKDIDTPKIKGVYHKASDRVRRAYTRAHKSFNSVYYSSDSVLAELEKAKSELRNLKDSFNFNDFNDKVLAEKASRLINLQKQVIEDEAEISRHIQEVNRLINALNEFINIKRQQTYEKHFFDSSDT